jgi:hypothetical protein
MKLDFSNLKNLQITNLKINKEASNYDGYSYRFHKKNIIQRRAKITPTKVGQFVTLWKRNEMGITCPFSESDVFDNLIVFCRKETLLGYFLFPKSVLIEKGFIRSSHHAGKRGFRVYPIWDKATSRQALKTQQWQLKHFEICEEDSIEEIFNHIKEVL